MDKQKEQGVRKINPSAEDDLSSLYNLNSNLVKRLTHLILAQSIKDKASDFFMRKTKKNGARLEYKIDGKKWEMIPPPSYLFDSITDEIRNLTGDNPETSTKITWPGKLNNPEAYVNLVHTSKSGLHIKFTYR
jgi:type II secretory ATPase GspE/PulE/Tfp pilus assembly ATPase PilB-like protein